MLVRTQPNPPAVSILSFPRDLAVDVTCPGRTIGLQKINAAYAYCGAPGSMSTIRALTGLPINYLVTVNFRGFTQVVDKLGGIWIDVDRRYFHSNNGTSLGSFDRYSEINLLPGYQRLKGRKRSRSCAIATRTTTSTGTRASSSSSRPCASRSARRTSPTCRASCTRSSATS